MCTCGIHMIALVWLTFTVRALAMNDLDNKSLLPTIEKLHLYWAEGIEQGTKPIDILDPLYDPVIPTQMNLREVIGCPITGPAANTIDVVLFKQCIDTKKFGKFKINLQSGDPPAHVSTCPIDYFNQCSGNTPILDAYSLGFCAYHSAAVQELMLFTFSSASEFGDIILATSNDCPFYTSMTTDSSGQKVILCMPSAGYVGNAITTFCIPANTVTNTHIERDYVYQGSNIHIEQSFSSFHGEYLDGSQANFYGVIDYAGNISIISPVDASNTGGLTENGIEWNNGELWAFVE